MDKFPEANRQVHRSTSLTYGTAFTFKNAGHSGLVYGGRLQRTLSQNGFEVIAEYSQPDTEMSSSQGRCSQASGYAQERRGSFGPWQKQAVEVSDSIVESNEGTPNNDVITQPAEVKNAIKALKNYQLNVVVDLKDILMGEDDEQENIVPKSPLEETANSSQWVRDKPNWEPYTRLSPSSSTGSFGLNRQYSQKYIDWKKKLNTSTYESTTVLADKYRNLEKSYDWLKSYIGKLQHRQKKEYTNDSPKGYYHNICERPSFATDQPSRYQTAVNPQSNISNCSFANRNSQCYNKDATILNENNQLKQQLEELYKLNRSYKRQAELCFKNAQNLEDQLEQTKVELDAARQQSCRLEELYQCSVAFAEELQREPTVQKSQDNEIGRLQSYIKELEDHIENENHSKSIFMQYIVGYKLSYQSLEDENKQLREKVRRCEVQHATSEDYNTPEPQEASDIQQKLEDSYNPLKRYGIPRLVISPPDEECE